MGAPDAEGVSDWILLFCFARTVASWVRCRPASEIVWCAWRERACPTPARSHSGTAESLLLKGVPGRTRPSRRSAAQAHGAHEVRGPSLVACAASGAGACGPVV